MAVLSLTWKSPYVDKTVFILRRGPGLSGRGPAINTTPLQACTSISNVIPKCIYGMSAIRVKGQCIQLKILTDKKDWKWTLKNNSVT